MSRGLDINSYDSVDIPNHIDYDIKDARVAGMFNFRRVIGWTQARFTGFTSHRDVAIHLHSTRKLCILLDARRAIWPQSKRQVI